MSEHSTSTVSSSASYMIFDESSTSADSPESHIQSESRRRRVKTKRDSSPSSTSSSSSSSSNSDKLPQAVEPPMTNVSTTEQKSRRHHHHAEKQQNGNSNKILQLIICASGICSCYLYFGIVQEKLFSRNSSSNVMKGVGNTTTFMLVLSCATNVLVSSSWMYVQKMLFGEKEGQVKGGGNQMNDHDRRKLDYKTLCCAAFCYCAAMTASNESLAYVSYPTAVLAKSSKLIPTMVIGFLLERRSYLKEEWYSAGLITVGIAVFNLSRMASTNKGDKGDDSTYGLLLLLFSLGMDGLLATCQNMLKKDDRDDKHRKNLRPPTALETMLWINAYAILFLLPLSTLSGQFSNGLQLLNKEQEEGAISIPGTVAMLNLTAAAGQVFIFFTIQLFSPLMCTTICNIRKFLTIILSVWKFGHRFTVVQWLSICSVFVGLYFAISSKVVGGGKQRRSTKEMKKTKVV